MDREECLEIPWELITGNSILGTVYKILVLDLNNDSYQVIKTGNDGETDMKPALSDWFRSFATENNVHPDDVQAYMNFTSIERIRNHFSESERYTYVRYRRKNEGKDWSWATMDIFIYPQKKPDRNKLLLIVRDIDSDYSHELSQQKIFEIGYRTDSQTGLGNRVAYINRCRDFYETNQRAGVIYSDLNGLKYTNDTYGHEQGDQLIKKMAGILVSCFRRNECYRVEGDEFVVLVADIEEKNFSLRAEAFLELIKNKSTDFLLSCSGYSWCENGVDLEKTVREAERIMYANKEAFKKSEAGKIYARH